MGDVLELADRRSSVKYTVHLTQGWDGSFSVFVEDVQDDPRSRQAVADALKTAADLIEMRLKNESGGFPGEPR